MILPPCKKLYKSELKIIEKEISSLIRLRTAGHLLGLPFAAAGLFSLIFPNILGSNITIDNLSKFSSIFFGGIFFASVNFFNKGDLVSLRKRKLDLILFIQEYSNYEAKSELERKRISDECDRIIQIRKGL